MVLDYIGVHAEYATLLSRLRITEFGASFHNLTFLEYLGVSVLVERGDIDTLRRHLSRNIPPIAFVKTAELAYWNEANNHAVVVIGIEGDQIFLDDPAFSHAPQSTSVDEFMLAWMDMDQFYGVIEK